MFQFAGVANRKGEQHFPPIGTPQLSCNQSYYSLAGRDIERDIIPVVQDQKMGLLVWSPLAGGFLSGKYSRNTQGGEDDRRTKFDFPPVDREQGYAMIDVLQEIAEERESTVAGIALAWLLQQPAVTSIIVGARRPEQLRDNLRASNVVLSEGEMTRLDEASKLKPEYPLWDP
ncbi:aldo/keto reductase [Paenibacillus sonchi]|nr:aldo/keto reductase [Paenibacillus sonchi]